jgi:hypothetical protein
MCQFGCLGSVPCCALRSAGGGGGACRRFRARAAQPTWIAVKHVAPNSKRAASMPSSDASPDWMAGHTAVLSPRPVRYAMRSWCVMRVRDVWGPGCRVCGGMRVGLVLARGPQTDAWVVLGARARHAVLAGTAVAASASAAAAVAVQAAAGRPRCACAAAALRASCDIGGDRQTARHCGIEPRTWNVMSSSVNCCRFSHSDRMLVRENIQLRVCVHRQRQPTNAAASTTNACACTTQKGACAWPAAHTRACAWPPNTQPHAGTPFAQRGCRRQSRGAHRLPRRRRHSTTGPHCTHLSCGLCTAKSNTYTLRALAARRTVNASHAANARAAKIAHGPTSNCTRKLWPPMSACLSWPHTFSMTCMLVARRAGTPNNSSQEGC